MWRIMSSPLLINTRRREVIKRLLQNAPLSAILSRPRTFDSAFLKQFPNRVGRKAKLSCGLRNCEN
jgi:hypothetical protein